MGHCFSLNVRGAVAGRYYCSENTGEKLEGGGHVSDGSVWDRWSGPTHPCPSVCCLQTVMSSSEIGEERGDQLTAPIFTLGYWNMTWECSCVCSLGYFVAGTAGENY